MRDTGNFTNENILNFYKCANYPKYHKNSITLTMTNFFSLHSINISFLNKIRSRVGNVKYIILCMSVYYICTRTCILSELILACALYKYLIFLSVHVLVQYVLSKLI